MPKEIKDMTNVELVEEFHNAAMNIHADFGFGRPRMEYVNGRQNLARHAELKGELLRRLAIPGVNGLNRPSDEELVEKFKMAAIRLGGDPVLDGPGYNIDRKFELSANLTRFEKILLTRMKELREGRIPRKKPTRMAVVGRKSKK